MLQLHLSNQLFYCLLRCDLYERFSLDWTRTRTPHTPFLYDRKAESSVHVEWGSWTSDSNRFFQGHPILFFLDCMTCRAVKDLNITLCQPRVWGVWHHHSDHWLHRLKEKSRKLTTFSIAILGAWTLIHVYWLLPQAVWLPRTMNLWNFNTLRPRQDGQHFPDDIFKSIFLHENVWISIKQGFR